MPLHRFPVEVGYRPDDNDGQSWSDRPGRRGGSMKPKATPQKASKKPSLRDLSTLEDRAKQIKAGASRKRSRK
jgi:hypothetical protein